jgi:hypothetical protein
MTQLVKLRHYHSTTIHVFDRKISKLFHLRIDGTFSMAVLFKTSQSVFALYFSFHILFPATGHHSSRFVNIWSLYYLNDCAIHWSQRLSHAIRDCLAKSSVVLRVSI